VIVSIRRLGALYVLYEKESSPPRRRDRRTVYRSRIAPGAAAFTASNGDGTRLLE
jgi:hypothetical protein